MARRREQQTRLCEELAALEKANRRRAEELGARVGAIEGHIEDAKAALLAHIAAEKARIGAMRARVEPAVAPLRARAARLTERAGLYEALRAVAGSSAPFCYVLEFEEGVAMLGLLDERPGFGNLFGVWEASLRARVRSRHPVAKGCAFEDVEWADDEAPGWELRCSARRELERADAFFSTRAGAIRPSDGIRSRETVDTDDRALRAFARVSVPVYVVARVAADDT